jgi:hypothetical protein
MDPTWIITLADGSTEHVQATLVGVSGEGSLLVFLSSMGQQPTPVKGYAPGVWKQFARSSLTMQ